MVFFLDSTESPVANGGDEDAVASPSKGRGRPAKPGGAAPKAVPKADGAGRGRPPKKDATPKRKAEEESEEDDLSDDVEEPPAKSPKTTSAGKGRPKKNGKKTKSF